VEPDPVLPYASYNNLRELVEGLLAVGENINTQNADIGGALYAAVDAGHQTMVKLLLDNGADVNLRGGWSGGEGKARGTALELAAERGLEAVVNMLLDAKVKLKQLRKNASRETEKGDDDKRTLEADSSKTGADADTNLALFAAVHSRSERVVRLLIDRGVDVNTRNLRGIPVFGEAVFQGSGRIAKLLRSKSADVNATTNYQQTLLAVASRQGREETVRILLDAEADPNIPNEDGETALHEASAWGRVQVVHMLLNAGADATLVDKLGRSALVIALRSDCEQVTQKLWTVPSGMSRREIYGKALIEISRWNFISRVQPLLLAGADPLFVDEHGANALVTALENGGACQAIVRELVDWVQDISQSEIFQVALSKAREDHLQEPARILLTAITDTLPEETHWEALQTASRYGFSDIVRKLMTWVPDTPREDAYSAALSKAVEHGHIEIVQILLEANIGIAPDGIHHRALIEALAGNHPEIGRLLSKDMTHGVPVKFLQQALIKASKAGRSEVVRFLLAKTALYPNQECIQQALVAAASAEDSRGAEAIQMLLRAGAKVNDLAGRHQESSSVGSIELRKTGHSLPLHAAAAHGNDVIVKMLLDAGVDVHARDHNGDTALDAVSNNGCFCLHCEDIEQILLAAEARHVLGENVGEPWPQKLLTEGLESSSEGFMVKRSNRTW
jgi:ankyrin repeat protein